MSMVDLFRNSLTSTDAIQVIGVANIALAGLAAAGCTAQSSSAGPAKGPGLSIVVGSGIAASVIGNSVAVISRQQVLPTGIPISIGMGLAAVRSGQDISGIVIGEGISCRAVGGLGQLSLGVIGVFPDTGIALFCSRDFPPKLAV